PAHSGGVWEVSIRAQSVSETVRRERPHPRYVLATAGWRSAPPPGGSTDPRGTDLPSHVAQDRDASPSRLVHPPRAFSRNRCASPGHRSERAAAWPVQPATSPPLRRGRECLHGLLRTILTGCDPHP